jgi:hypothetical protein
MENKLTSDEVVAISEAKLTSDGVVDILDSDILNGRKPIHETVWMWDDDAPAAVGLYDLPETTLWAVVWCNPHEGVSIDWFSERDMADLAMQQIVADTHHDYLQSASELGVDPPERITSTPKFAWGPALWATPTFRP